MKLVHWAVLCLNYAPRLTCKFACSTPKRDRQSKAYVCKSINTPTISLLKKHSKILKILHYLFEFYPLNAKTTHDCYITHTNAKTHEIIRNNLHLSAMYSGNIKGIGPRYCPSIEDKIARFPDKTSHHIFVEPEGASID